MSFILYERIFFVFPLLLTTVLFAYQTSTGLQHNRTGAILLKKVRIIRVSRGLYTPLEPVVKLIIRIMNLRRVAVWATR